MEGMREIAIAYYEQSTKLEQETIEAYIERFPKRDGKVSLSDLKKSVPPQIFNESMFPKLDENGDGSLDFEEMLTVYYLVKKVDLMACSGCDDLLFGAYFSCRLCLEKGGGDTFSLCCDCYRARKVEHVHSTSYLLDHHSLLAVLRKRITQSPEIQEKRGMEELPEIAKAYYDAQSEEVKRLAYEFYESMDSDGSGGVDLWEFLALMKHEGYLQMQNYDFFSALDLDGNGTLDFSEVRTLYYIIKSGRPVCAFCHQFIPGIYFSCVDCFKSRENSYSICLKCYRSAKYSHSHDGRTHFLDNYVLLEATRDPRPAQATATSSSQITAEPCNAPVQGQLKARASRAIAQGLNSLGASKFKGLKISRDGPAPVQRTKTAIATSQLKWAKWGVALQALQVATGIDHESHKEDCTIM